MASRPSKRRRLLDDERCSSCAKKKHLYLALDDWKGGYSIHKIDVENMEHDYLPEPAALRFTAPEIRPMAFAAVGANILIATNPGCSRDLAPPCLVYDTDTGGLAVGPRLPDGYLHDFFPAMAVGERLYAITFVYNEDLEASSSLQVLSWAPTTNRQEPWDPKMAWSWSAAPTSPPFTKDETITSYALHPDGHTIFVSTDWITLSFDTSNGVWRDLGDWVLPFRGQAYFDDDLDAWVGLHHEKEGYICCCSVAPRSAAADTWRPECKMLKEKLFHMEEDPRRHLKATLAYMGDGRFCLVENVLRRRECLESVLHVTVFGLKYDQKGELQTKVRRTTRSYALSKNSSFLFSHEAFWM
ncbi:hypothetical protein ACP70R_017738 [Stipagrostis hirtigluma subsp. patula]